MKPSRRDSPTELRSARDEKFRRPARRQEPLNIRRVGSSLVFTIRQHGPDHRFGKPEQTQRTIVLHNSCFSNRRQPIESNPTSRGSLALSCPRRLYLVQSLHAVCWTEGMYQTLVPQDQASTCAVQPFKHPRARIQRKLRCTPHRSRLECCTGRCPTLSRRYSARALTRIMRDTPHSSGHQATLRPGAHKTSPEPRFDSTVCT